MEKSVIVKMIPVQYEAMMVENTRLWDENQNLRTGRVFGMYLPLKTNRANKYAHVPLCHERECRTVCIVSAYGARVVHHFLSNS